MSLRAVTDKNKGENVNFELDMEFFGAIDVETTIWEKNGVGRVFFNITKEEQPSRWKRLLSDKSHLQLKPKMQFWVEMYLKYENELENYEPTEDGPLNDKRKNNPIPDYKKNPKDEATEQAV